MLYISWDSLYFMIFCFFWCLLRQILKFLKEFILIHSIKCNIWTKANKIWIFKCLNRWVDSSRLWLIIANNLHHLLDICMLRFLLTCQSNSNLQESEWGPIHNNTSNKINLPFNNLNNKSNNNNNFSNNNNNNFSNNNLYIDENKFKYISIYSLYIVVIPVLYMISFIFFILLGLILSFYEIFIIFILVSLILFWVDQFGFNLV